MRALAHNPGGAGRGVSRQLGRALWLDVDRRVFRGVIRREGLHMTATLAANRSADRGGTAVLGFARSTVYGGCCRCRDGRLAANWMSGYLKKS